MKTLSRITLTALLLGAPLAGCVSQEQYDRAVDTIRTLEARSAELEQRLASSESTLSRQADVISGLEGTNSSLRNNLSEIADQSARAGSRVADLQNQIGSLSLGGLDPQTDAALRQLAAAQPDLVIYDSSRGMLRFRSDLTFNTGSAEVRAGAQESIRRLAGVLTAQASGYDIRVVGHTDSQPITSAATKRNHPNNRYLSVHRAIAVSEALQSAGVPAGRIETAGWGSQRPLVANNANGGTPENRRVEIFIVAGSQPDAPPPSMRAPQTNQRQPDIDIRDLPVK